ncbi:helix-turn-helix domain-containing protein [Microbulbifer sp. OS29]|uniref:Helix-turn-helix domain-containing protein n=1 Tax=Microbulbifer okhotskensis TaxID=2926617 RepID=A0A9X2EUP6_9GAMM|nr:helix-turn-helix domain-containing protein [Microbulbifer okhotskensis]MCO1336231.1 helix-turn-helix domain-containing protein [Microbulbifer okhotskensis]
MNSALKIGERLREERKRLKFTQPELGELVGASKRTVIDWEKGVTAPNAVQLAALEDGDIDIGYVITGRRTEVSSAGSDEELELLALYRAAPIQVKAAVLGALTAGNASPENKPNVSVTGDGNKVAAGDFHDYAPRRRKR